MREILLSQGKVAIVDDEDYLFLSQWKWYFNNGYAVRLQRINGTRKRYYMHRVILDATKDKVVDHIDGNRLNNIRKNLRLCTHKENCRNQKTINGVSRFLGVTLKNNRWRASIQSGEKNIHLGTFLTEEEAALAYNIKASELYGNFASLNEVSDDVILNPLVKKGKTSQYHGVFFLKSNGKFRASVKIKGKPNYLCQSKSELYCARKYDEYVKANNFDLPLNFGVN